MSELKIKMDWLAQQDPRTFTDLPEIRRAFIDLNIKMKRVSIEEAEAFYDRENMYFKRVIHASWDPNYQEKYLGRCTTFSLYSCFMDMATYGDIMSFKTEDKLCYIEKRNYKAGRGPDGKDLWESRARLIVSPYGEAALRIDAGQILYYDPVIVVFEGDHFEIGTDNTGNTVVSWKSRVPRQSKKIIGAFVKITRPNNSYVMPYMLQEEIDRLAAYSSRQNKNGKANALYGIGENGEAGAGIDQGFLKAKTLKHGLGTFGKYKLKSTNSQLDDMEDDGEEQPAASEYQQLAPPAAPGPAAPAPPQSNDPFGPNFVSADGGWSDPEPEGSRPGVYAPQAPEEEEIF